MKESSRYLSVAETAKLMRVALKAAFPATKFSVRSHSYAGGASIRVGWVDGPTSKLVGEVSGQFEGGGFDGSIDMKYHRDHWLMPDGSTVVAYSPGTEGSRGSVAGVKNNRPHDDAELVHFHADFVFNERTMSLDFARKCAAQVAQYVGTEAPELVESKWGGWTFADESMRDKSIWPTERGWEPFWSWGNSIRRAAEDATTFAREVTA